MLTVVTCHFRFANLQKFVMYIHTYIVYRPACSALGSGQYQVLAHNTILSFFCSLFVLENKIEICISFIGIKSKNVIGVICIFILFNYL